jgi:glycosyltransferase involved in cell wall biosynthesis
MSAGAPPRLTVTVLTQDEAANLPRCLESVGALGQDGVVVGELLVIDSGSTDGTPEIARAAGAEVVEQPFLGYVEQNRFALARARGEWVLALDADEWLTAGLRRSIAAALASPDPKVDGFEFERHAFFLGGWIRGGGWREWKLRLVRRERARWEGVEPHNVLRVDGPTARLQGALGHFSDADLSRRLAKLGRYAEFPARRAAAEGRGPSLLGLLFEPPLVFFQRLILQGGIRDGVRGLVLAGLAAFDFFLRHARRWELSWRAPAPGPDDAPEVGRASASSRSR